jgi:hypothetical protein
VGHWGEKIAPREHRDITGAMKAGLIMVRDNYVWLTK